MRHPYQSPRLDAFGSLAELTRLFSGPSTGDVLRDVGGDQTPEQSLDGCAEAGGKCVCRDNGTC